MHWTTGANSVFGGHPDDGRDTGFREWFDATTGDYLYTLRNDRSLTAVVLTCDNLVAGDWATYATTAVTLDDGGLSPYTAPDRHGRCPEVHQAAGGSIPRLPGIAPHRFPVRPRPRER